MDTTIISTIIIGATSLFITFYYSRHTARISHDKMMKELFVEFNKRYSDLNDYLLKVSNSFSTKEQLDEAENSVLLKEKIIDYFNLCAEEFFWYNHKNRIDGIVWESWQKGMNEWFKVESIRALWEEEVRKYGEKTFYIKNGKGFFN